MIRHTNDNKIKKRENDNNIMSKRVFIKNRTLNINNKQIIFIEKIWKVIDKIKNKNNYNNYVYVISFLYPEIDNVYDTVRNELFKTNMMFNVLVNRFVNNIHIYLKIYDPVKYPVKLKIKFNKILNKIIDRYNINKYIYIKKYITPLNKLMALCYVRNFNKILGSGGYVFKKSYVDYRNINSRPHYRVYVNL